MPTLNYNLPFPGKDDSFKTPRDLKFLADAVDEVLKLIEVDVNDKIQKQKYFINVDDYNAKGDGVTDDTAAFDAAFDSLSEGDTLVVPAGKKYAVGNLSFTGKKNISILVNGKIIGNKEIFENVITAISVANSTITLENADHFRVGDQYSIRGGVYNASRHCGTITAKNGNILTVETNEIGENLSYVSVGEKIILTSSETEYKKIYFEQCDGIKMVGALNHNVEFKQCSDVGLDLSLTNASLNLGFCKNVSIQKLYSFNAPFYGLFFYSSKRINLGSMILLNSNFSGLVFKSTWDVNVGDVILHNPALMGIQVVTNTNPQASIPSLTDPELQNDLTARYFNFGSILISKAIFGIYLTQLAYNINISNYQYHDSKGNALRATLNTDDIKISKMGIRNHSDFEDGVFTTTHAVFVDGSKRFEIESLKIENSRGERPISVRNSEDTRFGALTLKNTRGAFEIASTKSVTISNLYIEDQKSSYANFEFGNVEDLKIASAMVKNIANSVTSRVFNLTGVCKRVSLKDITILSKDGTIFPKGLNITPTSCEGLTVENSYIESCTDAITIDKVSKAKVVMNTVGANCYNGIQLLQSMGDGLVVTNNIIPTARGIIDNSTTTKKIIANNATY